MTYSVKINGRNFDHDTLRLAVPDYVRAVTRRLPVTLYGPETLASDGVMAREVIAEYEPPSVPRGSAPLRPPPGGSIRAYWYARGQVDAMDGLAWFDEYDAAQFSIENANSRDRDYKDDWSRYLRRNEPREE